MAIERYEPKPLDVEMLPSEFDNSPIATFLAKTPGAVSISAQNSTTHKSGAKSPVYIDCRLIPSFPQERRIVTALFVQRLCEVVGLGNVDSIAGIATGGISHASLVANELRLPFAGYVDQKGTMDRPFPHFQGVLSLGDKVIVFEDHSSTGGSIIEDVKVIRRYGANVEWAFCISTYNFERVQSVLAQESVRLMALCDLPSILNACARRGSITYLEYVTALQWYNSL